VLHLAVSIPVSAPLSLRLLLQVLELRGRVAWVGGGWSQEGYVGRWVVVGCVVRWRGDGDARRGLLTMHGGGNVAGGAGLEE
jgi:hypothetical protein